MDDAAFWTLVERAKRAAGGDAEAMADALADSLSGADADALVDVQRLLAEARQRLYTWRHSDAGEIVCGYLGDDAFTDFRSWIISRGQSVFEAVVADPDALADVDDVEASCDAGGELFGAVPGQLYVDLTGDYFPEDVPLLEPAQPPSGQRSKDLEAIRAALPRLAARFPQDGLGKAPIRR